jgi:hypothetical protein
MRQKAEIIVKNVKSEEKTFSKHEKRLLEMIKENRQKGPLIVPDVNIRSLIDDSQYPAE